MKREHPLCLNVISCNKVTRVGALPWIRPGDGYRLLFISLCPPVRCHAIIPSCPLQSLHPPLHLSLSAPLRVIYGFISSRSFCQNKITICAIEQKLNGFCPKKKKKEKRCSKRIKWTRKMSPLFLFRS